MKNPVRSNLDSVEYKSSKRKLKAADENVQYSTREPTWEEQLRLPTRFHEHGKGTWPASRILEEKERRVGRTKKKFYLVQWEKHPETGEVWKPSWVPTADLLSGELLRDWEQWKKRGSQDTSDSSRATSHAASVKPEPRRSRTLHRIPDSSSEAASEKVTPSQPRQRSSSRTPSQRKLATPKSNSRTATSKPGRSASSPIEIAETQTDTSQRVSVSVTIPPSRIDKSEYESLNSSQINSEGAIIGFSPPHGQNAISERSPFPRAPERSADTQQPDPIGLSSGFSNSFAANDFTPLSNGRPVTPSTPKNLSRPPTRTKTSPGKVHSSPVSIRSQPPRNSRKRGTQPSVSTLHQHILSTSTSSDFGVRSPQYVQSTSQESENHLRASEELNSSGSRYNYNVNGFSSQLDKTPSQYQNGTTSSPWVFQTQAPFRFSTGKGFERPTSRRQSLNGFSSSARSGAFGSAMEHQTIPSSSQAMSPPPVRTGSTAGFGVATVPGSNVPGHDQNGYSSSLDISAGVIATSPPIASQHEHHSGPELAPIHPPQAPVYDVALGGSALPIQKSIEEEPQSFSGEHSSAESKASSSQQSVEHERDVAQVDGLVLPTLPVLGPDEYALALPAEGKIQSVYSDIIKSKKKAILKFLSRHESVGSANGSLTRTQERIEMGELIQQLNDTVTHMDLGLPGTFTQYSIQSEEHAAYANYAGSKFSLLGHLVDMLVNVECSIVIMSQAGPVQDLIEQYLKLKHINVRRQDRPATASSPESERTRNEFRVELISTFSTYQVSFLLKPILMIAFDASFDSQDPQVMRIRQYFSPNPPGLLPVVHFLVSNSSEHVDRCLPKDMPSPSRLKLLVRATYQARPNLGGRPTYVPDASDEPEGRTMDMADLQRGLRKTPERKLTIFARVITRASLAKDFSSNWTLPMPPLQLIDMDLAPSRSSGVPTMAPTPQEPIRSRTPASRAETPSGKKRMLDVDNFLPALTKRQRVTPLRDSAEVMVKTEPDSQLQQMQELVTKLQADIQSEREARQKLEEEKTKIQEQLGKWREDHANLQRRYEKRMTKCHELDFSTQKLQKIIDNNKSRHERIAEDNVSLKRKVTELQAELTTVREELKAGGGDAAALEAAREEARGFQAKNVYLEKSLENTRKDFEFTRTQYQEASNKAAEFAGQVRELETKVAELALQAGDEKRRLKEQSHAYSLEKHSSKIQELQLGIRSREVRLKKLEEENRQLKRVRGVQTRGSSVQPPGSPNLDAPGRGTRSRQASPAAGLFSNSHHAAGSNRGSLLRHQER
ncbi:hypothetical protein PV08_02432 [Exophiala spinifera]|uniref:Chromo domain-containing protein n=1 Tax=Exophiala spinifera TaxID=91928 RepID=A0A0D2C3E9_9EURO|nr:uncharacterized protein PV08_02432 [Exophiala spinifera]KIW18144.1 hypothetical protein PV08_02432 [Exophiala spinifera]